MSYYDKSYIINYEDGSKSLEPAGSLLVRSSLDKPYTVLEGDSLHSIAFHEYGDSSLWHIIAEFNNIYSPFSELVPGMVIIIPSNYVTK